MSIKLMTQAWDTELKTHSKMVLLALCDNATDSGYCFPSITSVAKRCSMSDRGVRNQIDNLIKNGYLEKQNRDGRSNIFMIADPCTWCSPAPAAPLHPTTPTPAPHDITPAPHAGGAAPGAPITITQPSIEPSGNHQDASAPPDVPDDVDKNVWQEFKKMRARIKAPLTDYACELLAKEIDRIGGDKNAVLNQSIMNGWKGVFPLKLARQENSNPKSAAEIAIELRKEKRAKGLV